MKRFLSSLAMIFTASLYLAAAVPAQETEYTSIAEALSAAQSYDFGDSGAAMAFIRARVMEVQLNPAARDELANQLAALLHDDASTDAFKRFACQQLYIIGGEGQVDELVPLLSDPDYAHLARYALEVIPGAAINDAVWEAIGTAGDRVAAGLTATLAARGGAEAVPRLTILLSHESADVVTAAIIGLGRQSGAGAEIALRAAISSVPAEQHTEIYESLIACAGHFQKAGDAAEAERLYSELMAADMPFSVRVAGLHGLADLGGERAVPLVVDAIASGEDDWAAAAMAQVRTLGGPGATAAFAGLLADATPDVQVLLLRALGDRGDPVALDTVVWGVTHAEAAVRHATVDALGALGNETTVPLLVDGLISGDEETAARSRASLTRLADVGANGAIVAMYNGAAAETKVILAEILAERRATGALPELIDSAEYESGEVRKAVVAAIGKLAGQAEVPRVASLFYDAEDEAVRTDVARALTALFRRTPPSGERAAALASLYEEAPENLSQAATLGIYRDLGDDALVPMAVEASGSEDAVIRDAAIAALAGWPNATPLEEVYNLARDAEAESHRALALDGYIRMLRMPSDRPEEEAITGFERALALSTRPETRRAVLAGLSELETAGALDLAESMLGDESVHAEAALASEKVRRNFYTLTASVAADSAALAADGDINTKWETPGAQEAGQWIEIDMSRRASIGGVVLEVSRTKDAYPRHYNVFVYEQGGLPGEPVATGEGGAGVTEVDFVRPVTGQIVRIEQTGATEETPWAIHEIRVVPE